MPYKATCVSVYTHSVIHTHSSSQAELKSTLVHEVPHHWEATTINCIVKARPTIRIHHKLPVSKVGQKVLYALKGATKGSPVKGSGWILWTWYAWQVNIEHWETSFGHIEHPVSLAHKWELTQVLTRSTITSHSLTLRSSFTSQWYVSTRSLASGRWPRSAVNISGVEPSWGLGGTQSTRMANYWYREWNLMN